MNLAERLKTTYFSKKVSYLIFFVTSKCNANCKMCFNWQNLENAGRREELGIEEIGRIARSFKDLLYLTISGGEPFLRKDLDEIVSLFYENCRTRFVTISTNGTLCDETEATVKRIFNKHKDIILKISLSLDGFKGTHDAIRGVNGVYDKVFKTYGMLNKLKKGNPRLVINFATVMSSFNQDELPEFIDFLGRNYDFDDHTIAYVRGLARDGAVKENLSIDAYRKAIQVLHKHQNISSRLMWYNFVRAVIDLMFDINLKVLEEQRMILPCLAGKKMLVIDDVGDVWPCELISQIFPNGDFKLGNLREAGYDIQKIIKSKKTKEVASFIKKQKCFCTFECATVCNIACNLKMLPNIILRGLRKR